jgi:Mce-associated membrane protein
MVNRHWHRPRLATVLVSIALMTTCALLAASGYLVWQHQQFDQTQQRRAEFATAAGQAVVTLMSIDSGKAQEDVQRIIDNSTGQFRDDFQGSATEFVEVAKESKAVTKASVKATAVEWMTEDSAVVLVTAATTITNSAGADQQPRTWRLSVDVVRDGGQIKMSKVDFVP